MENFSLGGAAGWKKGKKKEKKKRLCRKTG